MTSILSVRFECEGLGRIVSIGEYFLLLGKTVWNEGEGFSGKRPWGNSGWEAEVYGALAEAGFVNGKKDEDGYWETFDTEAADKLIEKEVFPALLRLICGPAV